MDLIPILYIKKLVLGATKSNVRYKMHAAYKIQPLICICSKQVFVLWLPFSCFLKSCTTCGNFFRKIKSGRGNGVIDQILHNAPEFCDVKIICEGKEMAELMVESSPSSPFPSPFPSPSPSPSPRSIDASPNLAQDQRRTKNDLFGCGCFKVRE